MSAYRDPPQQSARAPRASWWRRVMAFGLNDRLRLGALRHAWHVRYPWATWRQCQEMAGLQHEAEAAHGFDSLEPLTVLRILCDRVEREGKARDAQVI